MDNEDQLVENFFQELKEIDKTQVIPDMDGMVTTGKTNVTPVLTYWPKVAAAITLLALASFVIWLRFDSKPHENSSKEVAISAEDMEELMSWEEPTKSLLSDF